VTGPAAIAPAVSDNNPIAMHVRRKSTTQGKRRVHDPRTRPLFK
jgi:hypothetical protein